MYLQKPGTAEIFFCFKEIYRCQQVSRLSCLQPIVCRWQPRRLPVAVGSGVGVAPEFSMARALRALRQVLGTTLPTIDDNKQHFLLVLYSGVFVLINFYLRLVNDQQLPLLLKRASVDARFIPSQFESYEVQPQKKNYTRSSEICTRKGPRYTARTRMAYSIHPAAGASMRSRWRILYMQEHCTGRNERA